MTMMNPDIGAMQAASLPPVWRTPPGKSMSPAQYALSKGRNWSEAVNDRNFMQGYYGNTQSGPDYSGGRYVPPTFAFGYGSNGQIDPSRMVWNEQRNYYTPEQNYRFPTMPNFGMMEGIGNYGMNPFQQMMQMQQMNWMRSGMGRPGAADLFSRGGGEYGIGPGEGSGQSVNLGAQSYEDFIAEQLAQAGGPFNARPILPSREEYENSPFFRNQVGGAVGGSRGGMGGFSQLFGSPEGRIRTDNFGPDNRSTEPVLGPDGNPLSPEEIRRMSWTPGERYSEGGSYPWSPQNRGGGEYGIGPGEGSGQSVNLGQGFGNGVTNPFNRLTPTQYMEWLAGGPTDFFGGGRGGTGGGGFGGYRPRMPMFNMGGLGGMFGGGMFSPYFGFGGLGGMLPGGNRFNAIGGSGGGAPLNWSQIGNLFGVNNQASTSVMHPPAPQSGPPAPGGG